MLELSLMAVVATGYPTLPATVFIHVREVDFITWILHHIIMYSNKVKLVAG